MYASIRDWSLNRPAEPLKYKFIRPAAILLEGVCLIFHQQSQVEQSIEDHFSQEVINVVLNNSRQGQPCFLPPHFLKII